MGKELDTTERLSLAHSERDAYMTLISAWGRMTSRSPQGEFEK